MRSDVGWDLGFDFRKYCVHSHQGRQKLSFHCGNVPEIKLLILCLGIFDETKREIYLLAVI